jgi:hypothetical protein
MKQTPFGLTAHERTHEQGTADNSELLYARQVIF